MATDMGRGIMAPDSADNISATGVTEMRTVAATAAVAISAGMGEIFHFPSALDLTDYDTWRGTGFHNIPTHVASVALHGPFTEPGIFLHAEHSGGTYRLQEYTVTTTGEKKYRTMHAGVWRDWILELTPGESLTGYIHDAAVPLRQLIPDNTNADEVRGVGGRGEHYIGTRESALTMTNLPVGYEGPGNFKVLSGPSGYALSTQLYFPVIAGQAYALTRTRLSAAAWSPWRHMDASGGGSGLEPAAVGMKNGDLLDMMIQRKGGSIGTNGVAGFALRVDHGTDAFQSTLGPLLKKYGIPATMAVYSKQRESAGGLDTTAWSVVEQWHHTHGVSFGNHSDDHQDKPDASGWYGGTIGSAEGLKALMPTVPVEMYIPHGSIGYDRYGGFNQANSHESIVGTLAGRMALSSHALIAGYRGGQLRPLHGRPTQGLAHWTMEESNPTEFKQMLDEAIADRVGLAVMFHPAYIGNSGKMSWAQVEECFAYVAQKRDDGVLVPLTLDGLACADSRTSTRHDLHLDPLLARPSAWTGSGFTMTAGGFTTSSAGASVYHDVPMTRRTWARGGVREAQWKVNVTSAATVTVSTASTNGAWTAERTVQLATGQRKIHLPFGIPLNQSQPIRTKLAVASGGLSVSESHLYAN